MKLGMRRGIASANSQAPARDCACRISPAIEQQRSGAAFDADCGGEGDGGTAAFVCAGSIPANSASACACSPGWDVAWWEIVLDFSDTAELSLFAADVVGAGVAGTANGALPFPHNSIVTFCTTRFSAFSAAD